MIQSTLEALAAFPRQLERFYQAVPAEYAHWTPPTWEGCPSETLTASEQVCHVRDIEIDGYHLRFQRMLSENHPTLVSLDSYALARERDYAKADALEALRVFGEARARTVRLLAELTPDQLARTGEFEGYGSLTTRSLVHYLCSHDQQHLAGLQWLLGMIDAVQGVR